jgi:RND family efflux transporter MFP subunit
VTFFLNKSLHPLLILSLISLLLGLTALDAAAEAKKKRGGRAAPVKVEKVVRRTVRPFITLIGTAEPSMMSTAASEVEGLVTEFPVRLGQRVRKGDVLAVLEKTPLSLELDQALAYLAEAHENHKNVLSELASTKELFRSKTISSRQFDAVRFKANALNQKILALEGRIKTIRYHLDKCTIRAPFSGFIVEEHTQVGQWMKKGGEVVSMVDLDPILMTVPVPDRYIGFIKPGSRVDLSLEFMKKNRNVKGLIRSIIPRGNEKARTFPVQIAVKNTDFALLPGMSSRVVFSVGEPYEALLVNKDAFPSGSNNPHIFIVRDGLARSVRVKKGPAYGSLVVTEGKLAAGEEVVIEGNERLRPGQKVEVIREK